jgi:hypothetical protein
MLLFELRVETLKAAAVLKTSCLRTWVDKKSGKKYLENGLRAFTEVNHS